jgi:hypothetical protein
MNSKAQRRILRGVGFFAITVVFLSQFVLINSAYALPSISGEVSNTPATTDNVENVNIRSSTFKFVVCDGPVRPKGYVPNPPDKTPYIPCDFKGLVLTVQHFLNIAMVLGVMGTIVTAVYAGYLYVTGKESNISKAKEMLPKVGIGFVLMLTAWFIIAQILTWLTNNEAFKTFLKL